MKLIGKKQSTTTTVKQYDKVTLRKTKQKLDNYYTEAYIFFLKICHHI